MSILNINYSVDRIKTRHLHWLNVPQNKKLFYYATSAGRETLNGDYIMERENINLYMINYVIKGGFRLKVNGKETRLCAGDLTFLHLVNHSVLYSVEEGTEIIFFHILGSQTEDIYNEYLTRGDFVLHGVSKDPIEEAFERFAEQVGEDNGFLEQSRIIYDLLIEILKLQNNEINRKYPHVITLIMTDMMYSCPPPSPAELAEKYGYSQIYLERKFKRHTGESLRTFAMKQKYAFACRFLTDTDLSVEEIARKVGYADSKGLIMLFSKIGNTTPRTFRKNSRAKNLR